MCTYINILHATNLIWLPSLQNTRRLPIKLDFRITRLERLHFSSMGMRLVKIRRLHYGNIVVTAEDGDAKKELEERQHRGRKER